MSHCVSSLLSQGPCSMYIFSISSLTIAHVKSIFCMHIPLSLLLECSESCEAQVPLHFLVESLWFMQLPFGFPIWTSMQLIVRLGLCVVVGCNFVSNIQRSNLAKVVHDMKQRVDGKSFDIQFTIGEQVVVKLQKYRQSAAHRKSYKLKRKYFGPFTDSLKIGEVTYDDNYIKIMRVDERSKLWDRAI